MRPSTGATSWRRWADSTSGCPRRPLRTRSSPSASRSAGTAWCSCPGQWWSTHAATLRRYARKKFSIGYWKVAVLASHPGKALDDAHTPQSLKAQIALTGLLGLSFLLAPVGGALGYGPLVLLALLAVSWVPFLLYALRRDRGVALAAPGLLLVRAIALGLGLVWGFAQRRGWAGRRASQAE